MKKNKNDDLENNVKYFKVLNEQLEELKLYNLLPNIDIDKYI